MSPAMVRDGMRGRQGGAAKCGVPRPWPCSGRIPDIDSSSASALSRNGRIARAPAWHGLALIAPMTVSRRAFLYTSGLLVPLLLRAPALCEAAPAVTVRSRGARGDRRTKTRSPSSGDRCRGRVWRRGPLSAGRVPVGDLAAPPRDDPAARCRRHPRRQPGRRRLRPGRSAGLQDVCRSRDVGLRRGAAPGPRPQARAHPWPGPHRRQPVVAKRPEAHRAEGMSGRGDLRRDDRERRQLQRQPARVPEREHPRRHHPERLRRRDRSGLLPQRPDRPVPRRDQGRRGVPQGELRPRHAALHRERAACSSASSPPCTMRSSWAPSRPATSGTSPSATAP